MRPSRFSRRAAAAVCALATLAALCVIVSLRRRPRPDPLPDARAFLATGDAARAEVFVRRALTDRPRDALAWLLLAECRRLAGADLESREALRRAASCAPTWDAPAVALAARELADRRPGAAESALARTLRGESPSAAALRLHARARALVEDFGGAATALCDAAASRGGRTRDLLEAAELLRAAAFVDDDPRRDQEADALIAELLERVSDDSPEARDVHAAARLALGEDLDVAPLDASLGAQLRRIAALAAAGRADDASDALDATYARSPRDAVRRALAALPPRDRARLVALAARAPGDGASGSGDTERYAAANRALAEVARDAGRPRLATAHLREALVAHPTDLDTALLLGIELGRTGQGAALLRIAERLPDGAGGAHAQRLRGWFYVGSDEPERAADLLLRGHRATERDAAAAAAVTAAARCARREGLAAAEARAGVLVSEHPDDGALRLVLGMAAEMRGDAPAAAAHYRAALARDPGLAVAANDLAWTLATQLDRSEEASPLARWAQFLAPRDPRVADTAVEVRRRLHAPTADTRRDSR